MNARLTPTLIFRWIVFLLAGFYCVIMVTTSEYDGFGGPFRFLTIWALFLSFFVASRHIARMEARSTRRWEGLVAATAVVNFMVVFLYWKLFLEDPASVTRNGELGALWKELYLHGLGPVLMWIDALFLHRGWRKVLPSVAWLTGIVATYLAWGELVLSPLNDTPIGSVTSGLPYPFLNSLEFPERLVFYASNIALALAVLAVFTLLGRLLARVLPGPGAP
ncbi:MAG: hypothetical protein AAGD04_12280 [Pseudomonadota bacterium]